jgi:anti-sigma B factor antagonist
MEFYPLLNESERATSPAVFGWRPFQCAPDIEHVAIAGDLCLATAAELDDVLRAIRDDARTILLDLTAVTFLDSSGVHVIEHADARLRGQGRELVLVPGDDTIQRVFEITHASERLQFIRRDSGLHQLLAA